MTTVRKLRAADLPAVEVILNQTGLFPPEMLRAMVEPYLSGTRHDHWLVAVEHERPVGFAYTERERMTEGTFNLLAIAVDPQSQRKGVGKALVADLIQRLKAQAGRILLVETSSLDEYAATRSFYEGQEFSQEARIRNFYTAGEDKVVYLKELS